jgi:dipeptidyl aminopeptidase/acylaminoacyl peptidase
MEGEAFDCPQQPMGGSEDFIFSADGNKIFYVCKKISGTNDALSTNTDIYEYDTQNGKTKNISAGMKGYDTHPMVSSDGKWLCWLSMARDGYESDKNDIILFSTANQMLLNLTRDWDNTVQEFVFSSDNKKIYFTAYTGGSKHLHELTLPNEKFFNTKNINIRQLTQGDFDVADIVGQSGNAIIFSRTDMNHAPELFKYDIAKASIIQLTSVNKDIYDKVSMCRIEKRMIKTSDNMRMHTWIVYPPDFDPNKKYPALLYCQGGPQSAVSQFYSYRWNFQLMASKGYIVIAPNRRGLPGFGTSWNEQISGDWGGQAMLDYLAAVDSMKQLPFIDATRIGAVGASYGGYSVYMLAGIHNNRFKTFISHCGLFDLRSWYGSTEEMWFANWDIGGPYWDNRYKELYMIHDPINYAANWNTPILVIHGGLDYRVPETQGMEAFQLAQLKGIKSRFVYFPDEGHWIMKPQNGILWQREFYRWLEETL